MHAVRNTLSRAQNTVFRLAGDVFRPPWNRVRCFVFSGAWETAAVPDGGVASRDFESFVFCHGKYHDRGIRPGLAIL